MTELDLQSDDPEEFQGRVLRLDGAEYEIGPYVGEGGERFVHELINRRFGRATHLILILRDQRNAADVSARALAGLDWLRDCGVPVIHDHTTVRAHGGVFELREAMTPTAVEFEMERALVTLRLDEAATLANRVLATEPDNFVALNCLAFVAARQGDPHGGLKQALAALEIEPYTRTCKIATLRCALAAGAFRTFWWQFEDLRAKWPNDHSVDELAAEAHLTVGTPEQAVGLRLGEESAERVRQAVHAKERADEVMRADFTLADTPEHNARNREILERAYGLYDRSPFIAVNFGFALLRCDQGRAAHDVLAGILPMLPGRYHADFFGYMAFGLAIDRDWTQAYRLLDSMTTRLGDEGIQPADLPGWPLWWVEGERMVIYSRTHQPFRLIAQVLGHIGADRVRPAVRAMALLYAKHPANPT